MKTVTHFTLVLILFTISLHSDWTPTSVPDPRAASHGYVSDPHTFLEPAKTEKLNGILKLLEDHTGVQYAIVLLDRIDQNWEVQGFGVDLFEIWGLGQKSSHNGLLLLLVMESHDWRFFTGYGLEPILTDGLLRRLGEIFIVPHFRKKEYAQGLIDVTEKIASILEADHPQDRASYLADYEPWWSTWIVIVWSLWTISFVFGLGSLFKPTSFSIPSKEHVYAQETVRADHIRLVPQDGLKLDPWAGNKTVRFLLRHIASVLIPSMTMAHGPFLSHPVFNGLIGTYFWLLILLVGKQITSNRYTSHSKTDNVAHYFIQKKTRKALGVKALFFPFPFLFLFFASRMYMKKRKKGPFSCPLCGSESIPADRYTEEERLGPQKTCEKKINSINHRIFSCSNRHVLEIPFRGRHASAYTQFTACGTKAVKQTGNRTITPASTTSTGTGEKEFTCHYCDRIHTVAYIIPIKTSSSSGSGSSGGASSGGGGGSWGGGSTGGGGAGGKW